MTGHDGHAGDAELALAAAQGDERAFTELMRRHKTGLFQLARRLTGDEDAALDIVQEAFVGLWRAIDRYDPDHSFGAWARTATINRTRDWSRRRMVRRFVSGIFGSAEELEVQESLQPSPEQETGDRRELVRVQNAIQMLPAKLREPLVLTALEGHSYAQAAAMLGLSVKALETRIARARRSLEKDLHPEWST